MQNPESETVSRAPGAKRLEIGNLIVRRVQLGEKTGFHDGTLTVNAVELRALLLQDPRLGNVEIDVTNPGDSTRIVRIVN